VVDIKGYEGLYKIDVNGDVLSCERRRRRKEKLLKPATTPNGYKFVRLSKDGKCEIKYIHRIVSETFIPNTENKPCVNHKDGVKTNNHVSNLEWTTHSENRIHSRDMGLQVSSGMRKTVKMLNTETNEEIIFNSLFALAEHFGFKKGWGQTTLHNKGNPFTYKNYIVEVTS
jgi:hypothetical protein